MNLDEFSFVNQQLASMLKDGIPLEGALRQLCMTMQHGDLRSELESLHAELAKGTPLSEALAARQLPPLYVQMLQVGAQSNDLPAVLTLMSDHYQRQHSVLLRLKGLMVYPAIVLVLSLVLSWTLTYFLGRVFLFEVYAEMLEGEPLPPAMLPLLWMPPVFLLLATLALLGCASYPPMRNWLRWRLPALRDASIAHFASAMTVMLKGGCGFRDAVVLLQRLEAGTPLGRELQRWHERLAGGHAKIEQITSGSLLFPATFRWIVANAAENLANGFSRAAQIYQSRATYRVEILLYAALPVAVLFLGLLLVLQAFALILPLISIVNKLGAS
jgi:type II secretory pathway component PulF